MCPSRFVRLAGVLLCVAACQTYQFEPVAPLSLSQSVTSEPVVIKKYKPNLMVLVDKSGSMDQPVQPQLPGCIQNGTLCGTGPNAKTNPCNPTVCPTRWSELNIALDQFLQAQAQTVRFGFAFFPEPGGLNDNCTPTSAARVDLPADPTDDSAGTLDALAQASRNALASVKSQNAVGPTGTGGATPTGPSLQFFSGYSQLFDPFRLEFVLLLTDGLPNCNGAIPAGQCVCTTTANACPPQSNVTFDCLDQDRTVQIISALAGQGIHTLVIGFGAETQDTPDAGTLRPSATLQAMAVAGDYPRACPGPQRDQPCGPDNPCAGGLCLRQYYQANDATSLGAALADITANLNREPCLRRISPAPTSEELILVTVDGVRYPPGDTTWHYAGPADGGPAIRFLGDLCNRIENSTAQNPVQLELRILRVL
jgi:hypothetical protein